MHRNGTECYGRGCVVESPDLGAGKAESQKYQCKASSETWSAEAVCQASWEQLFCIKVLRGLNTRTPVVDKAGRSVSKWENFFSSRDQQEAAENDKLQPPTLADEMQPGDPRPGSQGAQGTD